MRSRLRSSTSGRAGRRLAAVLVLAGIVPPAPDQATRLETARDGTDHREAAFVALVEWVRAWPEDVGDTPIRLRVDPGPLLADPAAHRGELFRVEGVLQQRSALAAPYDGADEWFLRDDDGAPLLVYVVAPPPDAAPFVPGRRVQVDAGFYKVVGLVARDGAPHRYPAFVGAHPRAIATGGGFDALWPMALVLLGLGVVVGGLLIWTRNRSHSAAPRRRFDADDDDDDAPLPEDPAEALAELRRRSVGRDAIN